MKHDTKQVLITGASGFVGKALLKRLQDDAYIQPHALLRTHTSISRQATVSTDASYSEYIYSDFNDTDNLSKALEGKDCVIHCAARVHMMNEQHPDPLEAFRAVNTQGTLTLARLAASLGVKRFIFLSTIKTLGEETQPGKAYAYDDPLAPEDAYGISKAEAEVGLQAIASETGMACVIIRPPLVYGPGVKANFAAMMKLAAKNLPLPLGAIKNKRSMVALGNLVDLLCTCIVHPNAANQTFLVSDDHDVSVTALVAQLTRAAGKKPCLLPIPMKLIQLLAALLGKKAVADRLCGSLQLDITHTKDTLNWQPPITFKDAIATCVTKDNTSC